MGVAVGNVPRQCVEDLQNEARAQAGGAEEAELSAELGLRSYGSGNEHRSRAYTA